MISKLKNAKKDEDIIRELVEYSSDYTPLDKDRLVLFAVSQLESRHIEPTFDKIVAAAFRLFPKKFSLVGFPEYPDGRTIYYCAYNHCTLNKKWLIGNVQSAFKITERGRYFFDETEKMLQGKIRVGKTYKTVPKRKEATFLAELRKTAAFKEYNDFPGGNMSKSNIFEALKSPIDDAELAQLHLVKYIEYAKRIGDSEIMDFLRALEKQLGKGKNA
jgi:hypothetical protein